MAVSTVEGVVVRPRQETVGITLALRSTPAPVLRTISGLAPTDDGTSPEGTQLALLGTPHRTVTNGDGSYDLAGVPIGAYTITATRDGYREVAVTNVIVAAGSGPVMAPAIRMTRNGGDGPLVELTSPAVNAELTAELSVGVRVTTSRTVAGVQILLDDRVLATTIIPPYAITVDAALFPVGSHLVRAFARDEDGRVGSAQRAVTVKAVCGNGILQGSEECDLGGVNADTAVCTAQCHAARCGDGLVQTGVEACDLGAANRDTGACTIACKLPRCGDGFVQAGVEECDDPSGACTTRCTRARCGDGLPAVTEWCDDGNAVNGDGCETSCRPTECMSQCALQCTGCTLPGTSSWLLPKITASAAFGASLQFGELEPYSDLWGAVVTGAYCNSTTDRATRLDLGGGASSLPACSYLCCSFVARFQPDGKVAWGKTVRGLGNANNARGRQIRFTPNGEVITAGVFENSVVFGEGESTQTVLSAGGTPNEFIYVAKYALDGALLWAKQAASAPSNVTSLVATADGGAVLVSDDGLIARYRPDGALHWSKGIQGYYLARVAALPDGTFVVTGGGYLSSFGDAIFDAGGPNETRISSAHQGDVVIARYRGDGSLAWARRAFLSSNTGRYGYVKSMAGDADGGTVIGGVLGQSTTFAPGTPQEITLASQQNLDPFAAKFDGDGVLLWVRRELQCGCAP